jgi:hypothetical protein
MRATSSSTIIHGEKTAVGARMPKPRRTTRIEIDVGD